MATYVREREFQIMWRMLYGAIPKTPAPGGMGSKPIESLSGIRRFDLFIAGLPVPATGAVPMPVPPTVASLTIPDPSESSLVIGGYYVPAPPPTPPAPQALPIWTPVAPGMMYAVVIQAFGFDEKTRLEVPGEKSAVLYVETPSLLPPADAHPPAPLTTPGGLGLAPGSVVPNPAGGNPAPFELTFNAVHNATGGYEVYTNSAARSGMGTPGLMAGDRLVAHAVQPAVIDSQQPVRVTTDSSFKAGELVNLKVRAVQNVLIGGKAYSAFTAPLTTRLLATSPPAPPKNLRLNGAAAATSVPVQWDALVSSPPVAEYRIYDKDVFKMAVQAPATTATVPGYTASSPFDISIRAVSTEGESKPSSALKGTTAPA